jgi:cobalt/nickel transport system permease protein
MALLTPQRALWLYLAILPLPTLLDDLLWLAGMLALAFFLSGGERWRILRRALKAILLFNLSVSLGVVVVGVVRGAVDGHWLLVANLRVLVMVYLGFWFVARGDLLKALAGWPRLARIATIALGQIGVFERLVRDFRFALVSRTPGRPHLIDRRHHAAAQAAALLDKAQAQAAEVTQAMRARGAFD